MTHQETLTAMKADAELCNARLRQGLPQYQRKAPPAPNTVKDRIRRALERGPSTAPQLRDLVKAGDQAVHGAIRALIRDGKAEVAGMTTNERGAPVRIIRRVGA